VARVCGKGQGAEGEVVKNVGPASTRASVAAVGQAGDNAAVPLLEHRVVHTGAGGECACAL
jgi:hypothetical protein